MRTDSPALSTTAMTAARSFVESVFGEDFLGTLKKVAPPVVKQISNSSVTEVEVTVDDKNLKSEDKNENEKDNSKLEKENLAPKNAQNAHEAIRPAEVDGKVGKMIFSFFN